MLSVLPVCFLSFLLLQVSAQYVGGMNGPCSATTITIPNGGIISVLGNTTGASTESNSICTPSEAGTVWFSIQTINPDPITISTCSDNTTFDTIVSIYRGDCSSLKCVNFNDDSLKSCYKNYEASNITFTPASSPDPQTYFISVSGYETAEGTFEISFKDNGPTGRFCGSAYTILPPYDNVEVIGTNYGSWGPYQSDCTSLGEIYAWYVITPTPGIPLTVSTCSAVTNFNTKMFIISECFDTNCLYYNDDSHCSSSRWASVIVFEPVETQYYIAVGADAYTGNFLLSIRTNVQEYTTFCETATPATLNTNYYGDTRISKVIYDAPCFPDLASLKSVWFSFESDGEYDLVASTCNSYTDYITQFFIFSSPSPATCSQLDCVSSTYSSCFTPPSPTPLPAPTDSSSDITSSVDVFGGIATFSTSAGNTYFIVVAGMGPGASGEFLLTITMA